MRGVDSAIAFAAKQAELGDSWQLEEYPQNNPFDTHIFQQLFARKS